MTSTYTFRGLPDPYRDADFYRDVPVKRLIAWVVDIFFIGLLTLIAVPFTLFIGLFFLGFLFLVIGFFYRWVSISRHSATPGMRFMAIGLRDRDGGLFDNGTAFLHTLGYTLSVAIFPLQFVSVALMLMSARGQGLTDHILGTTALNNPARL